MEDLTKKWERLRDDYFVINYIKGYKSDAEIILQFANFARQVVAVKSPHNLPQKVSVSL